MLPNSICNQIEWLVDNTSTQKTELLTTAPNIIMLVELDCRSKPIILNQLVSVIEIIGSKARTHRIDVNNILSIRTLLTVRSRTPAIMRDIGSSVSDLNCDVRKKLVVLGKITILILQKILAMSIANCTNSSKLVNSNHLMNIGRRGTELTSLLLLRNEGLWRSRKGNRLERSHTWWNWEININYNLIYSDSLIFQFFYSTLTNISSSYNLSSHILPLGVFLYNLCIPFLLSFI